MANCFFRALAYAVAGAEDEHAYFRASMVDFMAKRGKSDPNYWIKEFDDEKHLNIML